MAWWKSALLKGAECFGYEIRKLPPRIVPFVSVPSDIDPANYNLEMYHRLYSAESLKSKSFYNVGAAGFYHPYWTNLDYKSDWYAPDQRDVVFIDLMKCEPLPIASGTAEIVYTSHTIEHVSNDAVRNLCSEAYRALKPGGYFRITNGPDVLLEIEAVKRGDTDHFYWDEEYDDPRRYTGNYRGPASAAPIEERWLHHTFTQLAPNAIDDTPHKFTAAQIRELLNGTNDIEQTLDRLGSMVTFDPNRPGNHVSWWTPDKAMRYMREAGFEEVYRSAYRQSRAPVLRDPHFFDSKHPSMSLYVEARKLA